MITLVIISVIITILKNIISVTNKIVCFGEHTHTDRAEVQEFVYFLFFFRACT